MILSPTQSKKLYEYLDIAFYPPETGPLATLDWMTIIQLGYSKQLTKEELSNEYQSCLKRIAQFFQDATNKSKIHHLKTLLATDNTQLSQLALKNQLPDDVFIAFLVALALEKFTDHSLPLSVFCDTLAQEKELTFTLSEEDFAGSAIAEIHNSPIMEKIQKYPLTLKQSEMQIQIANANTTVHFSYPQPQTRQAEERKLKKLLVEISNKNIASAIDLVQELSPKLLNQRDKDTGAMALQYALAYQQNDVAIAIIEKLVAAQKPLDISDNKFRTPFHYNPELILQTLTKGYSEYACSDYLRFESAIAPGKKEWVAQKTLEMSQTRVQHEMTANLSAHPNAHTRTFSKAQIQRIAEDIDLAKSACCTTFALSLAHKLLKAAPTLVFKLASYPNGMSSHCYLSFTAPTGTEFLLDPWLASLGWGNGVYRKEAYPWQAALNSTEILFDSEASSKCSLSL
ncbi:MAG: hypothetical protein AB7D28_09745 [Candidatus Berkiella sp.]